MSKRDKERREKIRRHQEWKEQKRVETVRKLHPLTLVGSKQTNRECSGTSGRTTDVARPELNSGDPVTEPHPIEKHSYNGVAFRLEDGKAHELYTLVDTHDQPVNRNREIQIKDTHGKKRMVPWGTMVYPLR